MFAYIYIYLYAVSRIISTKKGISKQSSNFFEAAYVYFTVNP